SSRRRHTRFSRDWSSDVCSSDLTLQRPQEAERIYERLVKNHPELLDPYLLLANLQLQQGQVSSAIGLLEELKTKMPKEPASHYRSEERRVGKEWRVRWTRDAA